MRGTTLSFLAFAAAATAGSAHAAVIVMPEMIPAANFSAYNTPTIERPWTNQTPDARLAEQPIGEVISRRLGLANGRAALIRYQAQGAPADKTMLDGVIDGGGSKLKLTW